MYVRDFKAEDETEVIRLWGKCNLLRVWNDPKKDIKRKLEASPGLFLVGVLNCKVCATAMGGFDGHRGWVNYLAVEPSVWNSGFGKQIMGELEQRLRSMGCPKINIQIRSDNITAVEFYRKIGYSPDDVVCVGKRLIDD